MPLSDFSRLYIHPYLISSLKDFPHPNLGNFQTSHLIYIIHCYYLTLILLLTQVLILPISDIPLSIHLLQSIMPI
jgi:hypothetical protein